MRLLPRPLRLLLLVATSVGGIVATAWGQPSAVVVPRSLIVPNSERIPLGRRESIEGGAFVARSNDPASVWYNPAGLALNDGSAIEATATTYEVNWLSFNGLGTSTSRWGIGSVGTLFSAVLGRPIITSNKWRIGFALGRPVSWDPSSLDVVFSVPTVNGGTNQVGYLANVDMETYVPSVSVGFAPGGPAGKFRYGFGLGLSITSISQDQTVSERIVTSDSASLLERRVSTDGTVWNAILVAGAQWNLPQNIVLGLRVTTPGLRLGGTSTLNLQSTHMNTIAGVGLPPGDYFDLTFRDESAKFEYRQPGEIVAGLGLVTSNIQVEVDARYYLNTGTYSVYKTNKSGTLVTAQPGVAPVTTSIPFVAPEYKARGVFDVAVGGSFIISRRVRGHLGVWSSSSPVEDETTPVFRKIDFLGGSTGISFTGGALAGSVGLGYTNGNGDSRTLTNANTGTQISTRLDASTLYLVLALTYSFPTGSSTR